MVASPSGHGPRRDDRQRRWDQARAGASERAGEAGRPCGRATRSRLVNMMARNNLQNPANKREILADAKLKPILGGKDKVSMFEMNKHLAAHLK